MSIWVEPQIICSQKYRFKNPSLIKVTNKKDYFLSPYIVASKGLLPFLTYYNSSKKNSEILVPGVLYTTHMRHFLIILLIHPWLCFFHIPVQQQVWCGPTDRFWDDLPLPITPFTVDPCCVLESLLGDVWVAARSIEWNAVGRGRAVGERNSSTVFSVPVSSATGAAGERRSRWVLILLGSSLWIGLTLTCVSQ